MPTQALETDFLIIGGGIAGASLAYWLAPFGRVIVLERESQPGYHSTGRSAAQFIASYGPPQVRALSLGSLPFLLNPPAGFSPVPILHRRSTLTIAKPGQEALLAQAWATLQSVSTTGELLSPEAACAMVPVLRPEQVIGAVHEPDSYDIDVNALHQAYLRGTRQHGGQLLTDANVTHIQHESENWRVQAGKHLLTSPTLINAAGAWCDAVADMAGVAPIGLVPMRRSAFTFQPPHGVSSRDWPLVIAADHSFYFKPDAAALMGSPANADPTMPQDVQAEELDVAIGMYHIEAATHMPVKPARTWAGLRSFVVDGDLVGGYASDAPGFFWCAAQGGYGIQTSAAMGQACAALVRGQPLPPPLRQLGLDPAMLSPNRLPAPLQT